MNEEDYKVLCELTKKAASLKLYYLACNLRDARDKVKDELNNKYTNIIINNLKNEEI